MIFKITGDVTNVVTTYTYLCRVYDMSHISRDGHGLTGGSGRVKIF